MSEPVESRSLTTLVPAGWYRRTKGFFGRMPVQLGVAGVYSAIALYPLLSYIWFGQLPGWTGEPIAIGWALFVALGYPTWAWLETLAFDRWLCTTPMTEPQRGREHAYFNTMIDRAAKFWQALIAVYAAAALLGIKPE